MAFFIGWLVREQILKKHPDQTGFQQDREEEAYHGTPEMSCMVDVIFAAATHIAGIDQVKDTKYDSRVGKDHVKIDLLKGGEENIGEDHC